MAVAGELAVRAAAVRLAAELERLGVPADRHDGYGMAMLSVWVGVRCGGSPGYGGAADRSPACGAASGSSAVGVDRGGTFAAASDAGPRDLMARMGHDSERAAMIYQQHEARGADQVITNAIDDHVETERRDDDDGLSGVLVPGPVPGLWS